jgi:LemA protein
MTLIIIIAVVVLLVLWGISVQNRLVKQDEFCNNSLKQINVQQMSRFDALQTAVNIAREEAEVEGENFEKIIAQRRMATSSKPSVADVNANEKTLSALASRLIAVAEQYPELKGTQGYQDAMHKYFEFEENVRLSRMTFNDSVTNYNRDVRAFPGSVVAALLHFPVREYLAESAEKADIPSDLFPRKK